jgi:hypothetical protein
MSLDPRAFPAFIELFDPPKAGFSRPLDIVMLPLWSTRPRGKHALPADVKTQSNDSIKAGNALIPKEVTRKMLALACEHNDSDCRFNQREGGDSMSNEILVLSRDFGCFGVLTEQSL